MFNWSSFRKLILQVHLWIGIGASIVLILTGVSGALLVFEAQIDRALNPKLGRVTPSGNALSLSELKQRLEQQYPGSRVLGLSLADSDDMPYGAYLQPASGEGTGVAVNQYTGQVLGSWDENRFTRKVHFFHTRLLAGDVGSAIVGWGSVLLLFLSVSGVYLWWRSKIFGVNFQSSGPKFQFDLHSTTGIVASLFLIIFAFTGIVVHWERPARNWATQFSGYQDQRPGPVSAKAPGAMALDPDQLLASAQNAVPGAHATGINLPDDADSPAMIGFRFPEDRTPAGRTRVFLDPYTGKVLAVNSSRAAPFTVRYMTRINREIHTGDVGGWPTRILAAIFSLALPLLAITGPLLWWQRRQRS
ncbi:MAG TPA: PepSY-associated TM helix domain-containing protein [Candidatus Sulfotelmatobacter sp.]|nr:PepSY-associated TM helix domain-containing protein [Candidatus Sulfotelmatobacter sp.]